MVFCCKNIDIVDSTSKLMNDKPNKSYNIDDLTKFEKEIQKFLPNHDVRGCKFQECLYSHDGVIGELSKDMYYIPNEKINITVNMKNYLHVLNVEII